MHNPLEYRYFDTARDFWGYILMRMNLVCILHLLFMVFVYIVFPEYTFIRLIISISQLVLLCFQMTLLIIYLIRLKY